MMNIITLSEHPEVKRIVNAAFPSYKKHKVFLSVFYEGLNINSYWDGGSRHEFAIVEMASMQRKLLPTSTHPYFDIVRRGLASMTLPDLKTDHVGNIALVRLPDGYAVVAAGTFCGKPATAHVYVNASNLSKLLPGGE